MFIAYVYSVHHTQELNVLKCKLCSTRIERDAR